MDRGEHYDDASNGTDVTNNGNNEVDNTVFESSVSGNMYINPFFKDETFMHGDNNDNNSVKKRRTLRRQSTKKLLQYNEKHTKCKFSMRKKQTVAIVSIGICICWGLFFIASITMLKEHIESFPMAYMFVSFQFVLLPPIIIDRFLLLQNVKKIPKFTNIYLPIFVFILIIGIVNAFNLKLWHVKMENQVVTDAGSDTFDTGMCQVIDKTKLNALKTPLFKNLVAPIALVPANINMSFALYDEAFFIVDSLLDGTLKSEKETCYTYFTAFLFSRIFSPCDNSCVKVARYCKRTCEQLKSECPASSPYELLGLQENVDSSVYATILENQLGKRIKKEYTEIQLTK